MSGEPHRHVWRLVELPIVGLRWLCDDCPAIRVNIHQKK